MATRKQPQRKAPRRKAVEPEEVERDLSDEGNPQELKDEEPAEEGKEEAPFEPKHSMTEAAKAYANMKAIKDYFGEGGEGDLTKMDHPGMREGLKALVEEGGPLDSAMSHVKDLVHEYHGTDYGLEPDELMQKAVESLDGGGAEPYDKSVKQLENDEPSVELKDDSFEQGEANLVDSGVTPETELEPLDEDEGEEEEEPEKAEDGTEEILERYQHPKTLQWTDRVVGKAWRAKNGRVYVKLKAVKRTWSITVTGPNGRSTGTLRLGSDTQYGGVNGVDIRSNEIIDLIAAVENGKTSGKFGDRSWTVKSLTDEGNPTELEHPPEPAGDATVIKDEHLDAIGKAADHLEGLATGAEAMPEEHQQHADALRSVHRDLSDEGNPQELKDDMDGAAGGGDLTEGVEELKDVQKIDGSDCEGGDNDDPECRAMFAAQDGGKSAKPRRKGIAPFDADLRKQLRSTLAESAKNRQEMLRKARLLGIPLNGSN